jgi:hypothetical protein
MVRLGVGICEVGDSELVMSCTHSDLKSLVLYEASVC